MKVQDRRQFWYGGIAGASFVAAVQLAGRAELNTAHRIALVCFAVSMPTATMLALFATTHSSKQMPPAVKSRLQRAGLLVTIFFCVGMTAFFCSFGLFFGVVLFVAAGVIARLGNAATEAVTNAASGSSDRPRRGRSLPGDAVLPHQAGVIGDPHD